VVVVHRITIVTQVSKLVVVDLVVVQGEDIVALLPAA
jgi:hypothetical protein